MFSLYRQWEHDLGVIRFGSEVIAFSICYDSIGICWTEVQLFRFLSSMWSSGFCLVECNSLFGCLEIVPKNRNYLFFFSYIFGVFLVQSESELRSHF